MQDSTPPPGLAPMARVTESVLPVPLVTVFPSLSWTATDTLKLPVTWMFWPELGCVVKASCVNVPAVMLKEFALAGAVRDVSVALEAVSS